MVTAPPKPTRDKPWHQYRREPQYRLLEPGYAGQLDDGELAYVQARLKADDALSFWWGFRPGQKRRAEAAIQRVAMDGDPETRGNNVKLARVRRANAQNQQQAA
jgi:hypothetical protein